MFRTVFMLSLFLCAHSSHAAQIAIYGEKSKPIFKEELPVTFADETAAQATDIVLTQAQTEKKITFQMDSSKSYLTEVNQYTQKDVIKRGGKIRHYGWCYRINGVAQEKAASAFKISTTDEIEWYYGYVLEKSGVYQEGCIASRRVNQILNKKTQ